MDWTDQGIVLGRRRHGESAAVVTLLTREHGRHAGLVRGGTGKRGAALYQPGNLLAAHWRARLAEHLGTLTAEMAEAFAARVLDDPLRLAGITSACAVLDAALPEREPHAPLFDATLTLLRRIETAGEPVAWGQDYARWEVQCLAELGFGLDLATCAATGEREGLAYVSPRTGRAVSRVAGAPYADKLFSLPSFLVADSDTDSADAAGVTAALRMTGHFLERHVLGPHDRKMPAARTRLIDRWRRLATLTANSRL
ncbi:MAG TPA: DNA repair protein RecO [Alphaproteobacteria bacterium]